MATVPRNYGSTRPTGTLGLVTPPQNPIAGTINYGAKVALDVVEQRDQLRDAAWIAKTDADEDLYSAQELTKLMHSAPEGGDGVAKALDAYLETRDAQLAERAPSARAHAAAVARSAQRRGRLTLRAEQFEAESQALLTVRNLSDSTASQVALLISHPDLFDETMAKSKENLSAVEASGRIGADKLRDLKTTTPFQLANGAAMGLIQQNPVLAKEMLTAGDFDEYFTADPTRKAELINSAEVQIRMRQNQADGALAERTALAKKLYADTLQVIKTGREVLPAQLDATLALAKGTEVEAELGSWLQVQPALVAARGMPLRDLKATVAGLQSKLAKGSTGFAEDLLTATRAILGERQAGADSDPISQWTADTGIPLVPIVEAARREAQADAASQMYGRSVPAFSLEDIKSLKTQLGRLPAEQAAQMLGETIGPYSPRQHRLIASKLSPTDPALAVGISLYATAPDVTTQIIRGRKVIAGKEVSFSAEKIAAATPNEFSRVYAGNASARQATLAATQAVYADRMSAKGATMEPGGELDPDEWLEALKAVEGGATLTHNGYPILPPIRDADQRTVSRAIHRLTDADLVKYGSWYDPENDVSRPALAPPTAGTTGQVVTPYDINEFAELRQEGEGRYSLYLGDGYVLNGDQQPYILDLGAYMRANPETNPQSEPPPPLSELPINANL